MVADVFVTAPGFLGITPLYFRVNDAEIQQSEFWEASAQDEDQEKQDEEILALRSANPRKSR